MIKRLYKALVKKATGPRGARFSLTYSKDLGSGYEEGAYRDQLLRKYKAACLKVVEDKRLLPVNEDGGLVTWCNRGCHLICAAMVYYGFKGLLANQIYAKVHKDPKWIRGKPGPIVKRIKKGKAIGISVQKGKRHGHCAMLYILAFKMSGKWGKKVPSVVNIGKKNGIMGANYAFSKQPEYFWRKLK